MLKCKEKLEKLKISIANIQLLLRQRKQSTDNYELFSSANFKLCPIENLTIKNSEPVWIWFSNEKQKAGDS